jgi:hypothetical protein
LVTRSPNIFLTSSLKGIIAIQHPKGLLISMIKNQTFKLLFDSLKVVNYDLIMREKGKENL